METHFPNVQESETRLARKRVVADLLTLATDAEALLRATADDASEAVKDARARLRDTIENARRTCSHWKEQGLETLQDAAEKTDETIRSHPYESIGIALGIGLILGGLLRRR